MKKWPTRCLTNCSQSNKCPLGHCFRLKSMQSARKRKTGHNDFKQRERRVFVFGLLQTLGYTVILQITSADQSHAPLGLSHFTSVHLSFAFVKFLRLTLPYRQFLKPDKGGGRKQDTAVELWYPCWFPKIHTYWKPPRTRLRGVTTQDLSHSIEIFIQAWKQICCCCNLCVCVWLNTQDPQDISPSSYSQQRSSDDQIYWEILVDLSALLKHEWKMQDCACLSF